MSSSVLTIPEAPVQPVTDTREQVAVCVKDVSKRYHLWKSPSSRLNYSILSQLHRALRTVIERDTPLLEAIGRRRESLGKDFHALQDINFTINKGESVGLIGRNGSGKSTLLQIIVNTLRPTTGEVDVQGRIAAMLELGSGFNPEFTGRENIALNAMILGLTPGEITERMEAIIEFADLGVFIDQPVKSYSSGMVVRLGFAVLTQIEPEILIIDEALAVGDFLFQQKCFDTIRRFRESGCTLVFVSHAMSTVMELCDRALLLDSGRLAFNGPTRDAVNLYEATALRSRFLTGERPLQIVVPDRLDLAVASLADGPEPGVGASSQAANHSKGTASLATMASGNSRQPGEAQEETPKLKNGNSLPPPSLWQQRSVVPDFSPVGLEENPDINPDLGSLTSDDAVLLYTQLYDPDGQTRDYVVSEEETTLSIGILCKRHLHDPHVGFKIRDRLGRVIFETSTLCMREPVGRVEAGEVLLTHFRCFLPIQPGEYSITIGFANGGVGVADYEESLLFLHGVKTFHVYKNLDSIIWSGVCNLFPQVTFARADRNLYVMEAMPEEQAARLEWRLAECPAEVAAGQEFKVRVEMDNGSELPVHSGAPHPVYLCYHWKDALGQETVVADGLRSALTLPLPAGEHKTYEARILAPEQTGDYLLEIAPVQEGVCWLEQIRPDLLRGRPVKAAAA